MSDLLGRLYAIEQRALGIARSITDILARLARAETNIQQVGGGSSGGGGGGAAAYWAVSTASAIAATGTWPTLTPATFTSDIYKFVGTTQTLVGSGKTVNWPYKDAMSGTAGKLVPCQPNADGTSYDAIEESCTKVT